MLQNIIDDIFNAWNIAYDPKLMDTTRVHNMGLKSLIAKPHNLYTVKNEKGEITEWKMKLVYTPFTKDDISVKVSNNILTIEIGSENKKEDDDLVYQGISNQYTKFSLALSDKIDTDKIKVEANDGILMITMPVKKVVPQIERIIPIN